jgi:predicted transcriptional regulator
MNTGPSGFIPESPYSEARVLSTKVSPDLHKRIRTFAVERDATVSAVIKTAVAQYLTSQGH